MIAAFLLIMLAAAFVLVLLARFFFNHYLTTHHLPYAVLGWTCLLAGTAWITDIIIHAGLG